MNLGLSPHHAVTVPTILNLQTGNISPQFHLVFDDWFTTVSTDIDNPDLTIDEAQWDNLLADEKFMVSFDDEDPTELEEEWLTELERKQKHEQAAARVQSHQPAPDQLIDQPELKPTPTQREQPAPDTQHQPDTPKTPPSSPQPPNQRESKTEQRQQTPEKHSSRPQRMRKQAEHMNIKHMNVKAYLAMACTLFASNGVGGIATNLLANPLVHKAFLAFDTTTGTFDDVDHCSFVAATKYKGKKGNDPDYPTYHQAMLSPYSDQWQESMVKEINTLKKMDTWTVVTRKSVKDKGRKVLPTTWAFRVKRKPDGTPIKFKSRWCVRGDKMIYGEDYWESFSPVVQWSSVRLLLIMSIVHGLHTRQVDYVNAFAQATLDKDVYVEPPQGFCHLNEVDCVLKLNKSLYGMRDAPIKFFNLLKSNLENVGFEQMKYIDPCLFVHHKAICVTYVDDCLWFALDEKALDKLINEVGKTMELTIESQDVSAFLGIQFTRKGNTIEMKQLGLIDKILEATEMQNCNSCHTPAEPKTLGKDLEGNPFNESWSYPSVVGMLLYLSGNSRPDITYAVNSAARFTHDPKESHAKAVKRIIRYLKGTRNKGLTFKPQKGFQVDCFVDADFCGLWGSEDPQDASAAKSRTGYIILVAGCPLHWVSKLQTEVSVSTMMAEYVALSQSMRDMLPLKRLVKTVAKVITGDDKVKVVTKSNVWEDNNGALTVATMPKITPQSKFFAVKYHFFREHVKTEENPQGEVDIQKIETHNQLADIMTKGLVEAVFAPLRDRLMGWDLEEEANNVSDSANNRSLRGSVEKCETGSPAGSGPVAYVGKGGQKGVKFGGLTVTKYSPNIHQNKTHQSCGGNGTTQSPHFLLTISKE